MKLVFIRTKIASTVFDSRQLGAGGTSLDQMKIIPKSGSSSKNVILGLREQNLIDECEEWKFWNGELHKISTKSQVPVKLFPIQEDLTSEALTQYIRENEEPAILWVEGPDFPPYLQQIFELCPNSFKMVYSKDWRPWKVRNLGQYDLCLVDEVHQSEKVNSLFPNVHCAVWDKLIDYQTAFYPVNCGKTYDICYVAYLRRRKNQELLFRAMAKLKDRNLTCVCVGADRKDYRKEMERLVIDLNLSVQFTGEIPREQVNDYINRSRIGVMCSKLDAAPRALLEYMAADVPVLVNSQLLAGARYVGKEAGLVKSPEEFHLGIAELLDNVEQYSPRRYYLSHYNREKTIRNFLASLTQSGCKMQRIPERVDVLSPAN